MFDAKHEVNDRAYELLSRDGDAIESEFVCECDDVRCIMLVALTIEQFAALRATERPILAAGHGFG